MGIHVEKLGLVVDCKTALNDSHISYWVCQFRRKKKGRSEKNKLNSKLIVRKYTNSTYQVINKYSKKRYKKEWKTENFN